MNGVMRTIGRMTAAGAVALLLAGSKAAPAEARPPMRAYWAIADCEDAGGDAFYFNLGGIWAVSCHKGGQTTLTGGSPGLD